MFLSASSLRAGLGSCHQLFAFGWFVCLRLRGSQAQSWDGTVQGDSPETARKNNFTAPSTGADGYTAVLLLMVSASCLSYSSAAARLRTKRAAFDLDGTLTETRAAPTFMWMLTTGGSGGHGDVPAVLKVRSVRARSGNANWFTRSVDRRGLSADLAANDRVRCPALSGNLHAGGCAATINHDLSHHVRWQEDRSCATCYDAECSTMVDAYRHLNHRTKPLRRVLCDSRYPTLLRFPSPVMCAGSSRLRVPRGHLHEPGGRHRALWRGATPSKRRHLCDGCRRHGHSHRRQPLERRDAQAKRLGMWGIWWSTPTNGASRQTWRNCSSDSCQFNRCPGSGMRCIWSCMPCGTHCGLSAETFGYALRAVRPDA
jgi:hypothetical protein